MERMGEIERTSPDGEATFFTTNRVEDLIHDGEAEESLQRLIEILRNRPELRQYITRDTAANAASVIKRLRAILQDYPNLVKELVQIADSPERDEKEIVMALLPEFPLVLTRTQEGIVAFAPALTCTLNAISDLTRDKPPRTHFITISNNVLIPYILRQLDHEDNPIISYDRTRMSPSDYIALGATGMFFNETFRVTLPKP